MVEPYFLDESGRLGEPDIVATSERSWLCLEITFWNGSKQDKLNSYQKLMPDYLGNYGLRKLEGSPDVLSARFDSHDDGPYCQILLSDELDIRNSDKISDLALKKALEESIGLDLTRTPQTRFTIVPECGNGEIRKGIFDQVMQLFEPEGEGLTAAEITENALDSLSDKIRPHSKHVLIKKVHEQMNILVNNELEDYLTKEGEKFKPSKENKDHYATREKIGRILQKWAGLTLPRDTKLTDFA